MYEEREEKNGSFKSCKTYFVFCLLQEFPIKDALSGGILLEEYRPDLINMILEKLTADDIR